MKKSEMLDIIWNAGGILKNEYPNELKDHITNEILEAIEKAGMLPPKYFKANGADMGHRWEWEESLK